MLHRRWMGNHIHLMVVGGRVARGINRGRQRRAEIAEKVKTLKEERAARTHTQQLALLDKRLGKGMGARKERERLNAQLEGA